MEDVVKRRERLKALREKKANYEAGLDTESSSAGNKENEDQLLPKPVFRSYRPNDENLQQSQMFQITPVNVKAIVEEEIKAAQEKNIIEEVKLTHLAPRKIDWDLKRDISKKLEKLRKRTNRAIAEIAHEELINGRNDIPVWNSKEESNPIDEADDDDD